MIFSELKINSICNNRCSFCVNVYDEINFSSKEIRKEIKRRKDAGLNQKDIKYTMFNI